MSEQNKPEGKYIELKHQFYDRFDEQDVEVAARFKRPITPQISRAQKGMLKNAAAAFSNLIMEVVHPDDKVMLKKNLEKYPGLATTFGNGLLGSCGMGDLGN